MSCNRSGTGSRSQIQIAATLTVPGLRALHDDVVLAGVKAKPSGWPPASLDPGSERRPLKAQRRNQQSKES